MLWAFVEALKAKSNLQINSYCTELFDRQNMGKRTFYFLCQFPLLQNVSVFQWRRMTRKERQAEFD